jgi:hypothetical protein
MPVLPPIASAPYDTVETVLKAARVRVNDAIQSIGGDMLTDTQPFTQVMANLAWRKMQNFLANLGFSRARSEAIVPSVPVVANYDPATQVYLAWSGFYDGNALNTGTVLPGDCIMPLRVWERVAGSNTGFSEMPMVLDGLPDCSKVSANRTWEWRNDAMYMPGSTVSMDLRIRYAAYLPDFATIGQVLWYNQPVPIARCLDALSNYIAAEFAIPRADMDAQTYINEGEKAARKIFNREAQAKQRTTATRRAYSSRSLQSGFGNS